jgi:hypothetical protein
LATNAGRGEKFDGGMVKAQSRPIHPAASSSCPATRWHLHWAKSGEYLSQVNGIGPLGLEYQDPGDDPRGQIASA